MTNPENKPSGSGSAPDSEQPSVPTLELNLHPTINPKDTLVEFAPEDEDEDEPAPTRPRAPLAKPDDRPEAKPEDRLEASLEHSDHAPFIRPEEFDTRRPTEDPLEILPMPLDEPLELEGIARGAGRAIGQASQLSPVPPELDPDLWDQNPSVAEDNVAEDSVAEDLEAILAAEEEGMEPPELAGQPHVPEHPKTEREDAPLEPSEPSAQPIILVQTGQADAGLDSSLLEPTSEADQTDANVPLEPAASTRGTPLLESEPLEEVILASTTGEQTYPVGQTLEWGEHRFKILEPLARGWYRAAYQGAVFGGATLTDAELKGEQVLLKPDGDDPYPTLPPHRLTPKMLYSGPEGYALPKLEGSALRGVMPFEKALSALTLLAQYTFALEKQGYALLDLEPQGLLETAQGLKLSFPPRLVKLGEALPPLEREGYTAPEVRQGGVASGKEGVYLLGATLLEWLTGMPPLSAPLESVKVPGVPQLLYRSLSSRNNRFSPLEFLNALRALAAPAAPVLELGHGTTVGLNPDRPVNEDSYGYRWERIGTAIEGFERLTVVVCDGMGGMAAGEVASNAAVKAFVAGTHGELRQTSPQLLEGRVWKANRAVLEDMKGQEGGCTLSGAVLEGANFTLAHVGDSRAYKASGTGENARLEQISQDHSLVAAMVASGMLTPEEAMVHPDKNKILRSLGSLRQEQPGYVQTLEGKLEVGQALLLVSDGVWNEVPDAQILELWKKHSSTPQRLVDELISASLEAGAPDNATAVVVKRRG